MSQEPGSDRGEAPEELARHYLPGLEVMPPSASLPGAPNRTLYPTTVGNPRRPFEVPIPQIQLFLEQPARLNVQRRSEK